MEQQLALRQGAVEIGIQCQPPPGIALLPAVGHAYRGHRVTFGACQGCVGGTDAQFGVPGEFCQLQMWEALESLEL